MEIQGGCYCGALRFQATGDPMFKGQCHCRECQYISGGHPNVVMGMAEPGFKWSKGSPKQFKRKDLPNPVTREFCAECGTHLVTRPNRPIVVVKVGTLDDPKVFGTPGLAIYTIDKQPFHQIPEGLKTFERLPG